MKKEFIAGQIDAIAFTDTGSTRQGHEALLTYERLWEEAQGPTDTVLVNWHAQGELRAVAGAEAQRWLHISANTVLPLTCQRCLTPVQVPLISERWFRFVADEATAEAQDDQAEEDLLVISREFDLHALVEDELLMALPVVPRHDSCPTELPMSAADADFDAAVAENPHPFAALAALQKKK